MKKMSANESVGKKMRIKGTFRAVDMLLHAKPKWDSVAAKIHYMIVFPQLRGDCRAFRVFAQAKTAIRHRQWEQLFDKSGIHEVTRIPGLFEDWEPYKRRLTNHSQQIIVEHGARPVRLARMTELEQANEKIQKLEDEIRLLRAEISQNSKFHQMCVDEAKKNGSAKEDNSADEDDSEDDSADDSEDDSEDDLEDYSAEEDGRQ